MTEDELKQFIQQLEISVELDGELPITNKNLLRFIETSIWNTRVKYLDEMKEKRDKLLDDKLKTSKDGMLSFSNDDAESVADHASATKSSSSEINLDTTTWRKSKSLQEHVRPITTEPFTIWATVDYLLDSFFEADAPKAWFFDHHTTAWELIAPFSSTCDYGELGVVHTKPTHEDLCRIFPFWTYKENIADLHELVDFSKTK